MRFSDFGKRVVFAAFDGGEITSDAGVLLLREQARRIRLFERMADCFNDRRDPTRTVHTLPALLAQRVAGIALGYEDINDHDALRHDPACKLLADCGGEPAPDLGRVGEPGPRVDIVEWLLLIRSRSFRSLHYHPRDARRCRDIWPYTNGH